MMQDGAAFENGIVNEMPRKLEQKQTVFAINQSMNSYMG